jgi:hypothetical protein
MKVLFAISFLLASTALGNEAEDAVLRFFYLSAKASSEGNPDLISQYVPADGFILIDRTRPDQSEIHVSKEDALRHQTTVVTDLLKSGKFHTVTLPKSIEVLGDRVVVHAQMIEVSVVEGKEVAGVSTIRSEFDFRDGHLKILKSEMLANDSFPLATKENVEQDAAANP